MKQKKKLKAIYQTLNPFKLKKELETKLDKIFSLLKEKKKRIFTSSLKYRNYFLQFVLYYLLRNFIHVTILSMNTKCN